MPPGDQLVHADLVLEPEGLYNAPCVFVGRRVGHRMSRGYGVKLVAHDVREYEGYHLRRKGFLQKAAALYLRYVLSYGVEPVFVDARQKKGFCHFTLVVK